LISLDFPRWPCASTLDSPASERGALLRRNPKLAGAPEPTRDLPLPDLRLGFKASDFFRHRSFVLRHFNPIYMSRGCTAVTAVTMLDHNYLRGMRTVTLPLQAVTNPVTSVTKATRLHHSALRIPQSRPPRFRVGAPDYPLPALIRLDNPPNLRDLHASAPRCPCGSTLVAWLLGYSKPPFPKLDSA
jgi:hypothetical protein